MTRKDDLDSPDAAMMRPFTNERDFNAWDSAVENLSTRVKYHIRGVLRTAIRRLTADEIKAYSNDPFGLARIILVAELDSALVTREWGTESTAKDERRFRLILRRRRGT